MARWRRLGIVGLVGGMTVACLSERPEPQPEVSPEPGGPVPEALPGVVSVVLGDPLIVGPSDRMFLDGPLLRHLPAIRACYQRRLAEKPSLSGSVTVRFTILTSGAVREASWSAYPSLADPDLEKCVLGEFDQMRFTKPAGILFIEQPMDFFVDDLLAPE